MNKACDKRFDSLRDDHFFWNHITDAVWQENKIINSEMKKSTSVDINHIYYNNDFRYRNDYRD